MAHGVDPGAAAAVLPMGHQSDSLEQRTAEPLILAGVAKMVGVELTPRSLLRRLDESHQTEDLSL